MGRLSRLAAAAAAAAALGGCATVRSPDPRDPWEPMNRGTFEFNDGVDRIVLKPIAETYRFVLPEPVRAGVRNFYENLRDPWIALNQLLQGKVEEALSDGWRFIANSTFGLGGIFDIASDMGMAKHNEDFGQTLAVWGLDFGPYLVIPILGPSSVRDGTGTLVATQAYLPWQLPKWLDVDHRVAWQNWLTGIDIVQTRAGLLEATDLLEQAALDRYAFIRNAYFQRRRNLIYDGNPPPLPPSEPESGGVEPKIPANYEAVLAAGARHAAAAGRSQERIP
jgi:phospholipid-binding lipoprotein MlaA